MSCYKLNTIFVLADKKRSSIMHVNWQSQIGISLSSVVSVSAVALSEKIARKESLVESFPRKVRAM